MAIKNSKHEDFYPFFIVGSPRYGTTLLAVLLDRHFNISIPPETFFFHVFNGVSRLSEQPNYHCLMEKYLENSYMSALNLDKSKLLDRLQNYNADHSSFFRCALEEYAFVREKSISGEKTATHLKYVKTIFDWYPNAKVIWLVRDGRDVAMAMMRLFHKNLRGHCCNWRMSVKLELQFERQYPDKFYRTHFEDIILNPETELKKICKFLNVDYQDRQLDTDIDSGTVTEKEKFYKERALKPLDTKKIGEWKRVATPQQIYLMHFAMGKYLQILGYRDDFNYGSLKDKLYNSIVQIPFDLAFEQRIHSFLHRNRIRLRRLAKSLKS